MPEQIGDDTVYLRLQQLKEGKIQYTDSRNTLRLMREHGADIRHNAAWKKWIVLTGKNQQIDEGYLIHERDLRIVRGIYDDVLKTDDYQERMEIEKYAMQSETMRRRKTLYRGGFPDSRVVRYRQRCG
jgi:putative DNA primase/helicase